VDFRIADTFTDSLARLTGEEQKAVKTTAFDLQMNLASPSLSFHKLDRAKDKNFWSVRVSKDIRIIVHRTPGSLLLCYVDHHDQAYRWAESRKLETHPRTGAAQLVEIRETVQQVHVPVYVPQEQPVLPKPPLFRDLTVDELLGYGVPAEWVEDVQNADEDTLLQLSDHLPSEAAEALLELATGGKPRVAQPVTPAADPFDHPDAQRRFRVMTNLEELERALDFPWEKWTIFLHPEQRQLVEKQYTGPARVSGSAGTGKTIVALHRAVHLTRVNSDARVLLATFSETLAHALRIKLRRLIGNEPRLGERIDVYSMQALAQRLYKAHFNPAKLAGRDDLVRLIGEAAAAAEGHKFSLHFLVTEWEQVVDAWQLGDWNAYRDVARLGRKTRLPESRRAVLWGMFEQVRAELKMQKLITLPAMFTALADEFTGSRNPPFDFAVVDEAQDISVSQLRFFAAIGADRPDALFFAGDLGQRIFQQPFSWKSLGVDIRGRSSTLRINYRTSHQIREQADRLLGPEITDVDGNVESRRGTISVFNGPPPQIHEFGSEAYEIEAVARWIAARCQDGALPHEIGVFVRSSGQLPRAKAAVEGASLPSVILDHQGDTTSGHVSISTMHQAKGLEFRFVVVMACDDEVIPLQERIETVGDDADLQEVYDTERHLLYVACTRARDQLFISGVKPRSEFLDDMETAVSSRTR
jgi:superfamily I DNA/RNA helicase/mRNA-degrading endonuclease RelE of RelBE toxin-antitoxin system